MSENDSGEGSQSQDLRAILEFVKNSKALNGGFDDLKQTVDEIKQNQSRAFDKIEHVEQLCNDHQQQLQEMNEALYNPDEGVYRRVKMASESVESQRETIEELKEQTNTQEEELKDLIQTKNTLKHIGGKELEDLRKSINHNKTLKRLMWAFVAALTVGAARFIWDVVPNISVVFS